MTVGLPRDVECPRGVEHGLIPVARVVEEHDLLGGRDRDTVQLDVPGCGAAEGQNGAGPADELLDRRGQPPVQVLQQHGALVGVLGQRPHGMRRGVARGVVACHRQEHEEGCDLVVGQPLAVDLGLDQGSHQVVARLALAKPGQLLGERRQAPQRLAQRLDRRLVA